MKELSISLIVQLMCCTCLFACKPSTDSSTKQAASPAPICGEWIHPDKHAYEVLGRRLADVLINAKTINVYSLSPKETINSDDYEIDSHFVRTSNLGSLTKDQATVLKYNLISNGANYHKDSTFIVMSPYCPIIEFEFIKKKETAHVIISLSDFSWSIKYDDKIQFRYNYAGGTFIRRFCEYFLKKDENYKE